MKLVTFTHNNGASSVGALVQDRVIRLSAAYQAYLAASPASPERPARLPDDILELLSQEEAGMAAARQALEFAVSSGPGAEGLGGEPLSLPLESVQLLAPIPRPGKIICIGLNYRDHAEEVGMKIPERPLVFSKYSTAVAGPGAPVVLPEISAEVDYEAEMAVVIGKVARKVPEFQALDYVAGYTIMNDVSARDLQLKLGGGQWVWGKTLDTFAPLGPVLVTSDEVPDPADLNIALRLNGQTMQRSNTRNLIFGVPQLIAFLSQAITLEPGDVIATGTPGGVGLNRQPPVFLKPVDVMAVEVEKLGVLENPVISE